MAVRSRFEGLPEHLLMVVNQAGERIDPKIFGGIFTTPTCSPCIGATLTDRDGNRWTVKNVELFYNDNIGKKHQRDNVVHKFTMSMNGMFDL